VVALGGVSLMRLERKYRAIATQINDKRKGIPSRYDSREITIYEIPVDHILYVEALQNYVKIGHFNPTHDFSELTERATLKAILGQVEGTSIVKCHRSFLVNRNVINSASGNAQGLLLSLTAGNKKIPVSRSFVKLFRDL
jgi:DNA-binding LytR/AlgR family response regulator